MLNAPRQTFRTLPQQVASGAAEYEKARGRSAVMGSSRRAGLVGSSRSKELTELSSSRSRARVVLPHWRGPMSMTMRLRLRAAEISVRRGVRSIIDEILVP